jgi:hypothetical protein
VPSLFKAGAERHSLKPKDHHALCLGCIFSLVNRLGPAQPHGPFREQLFFLFLLRLSPRSCDLLDSISILKVGNHRIGMDQSGIESSANRLLRVIGSLNPSNLRSDGFFRVEASASSCQSPVQQAILFAWSSPTKSRYALKAICAKRPFRPISLRTGA